MGIDSYLHTRLSPYQLNADALKLIKKLDRKFSFQIEEKIIILINAASMHPSMSEYQLSLTHQALGDCYYKHGFYESALQRYECGLSLNPRLPVKRKIKEISAMQKTERPAASSPDLVADVLQYPEYTEISRQTALSSRNEENEAIIYDPAIEAEIERRLDALGEPYRSEFYRIRDKRYLTRRPNDTLSLYDYALLDLKAMEKSAAYRGNSPSSLETTDES